MRRPTMGNLFSGSGTWELAAKMCGIDVMWEAEIEPFPVAVEAKRFPEAIQLGDVSKISGADIPPVDIMTNSSPCQDLSIAGKRDGLSGERSGLFNDAVRIAKEMLNAERNRTDDDIPVAKDRRPKLRFWCWENVPGALSSNKGEDFRTVIESVARLVQEDAVIPLPPKGWSNAGVVDGDGWQLAWRVMDAQYFGVPQRRRRIFLVADLAGKCAGEVLFERESLPGYFAEIASSWEDTSRSLGERISVASRIVMGGVSGETEGMERSITKDAVGFDMYNQEVTENVSRTLKTPVGGDDKSVAFCRE